MDTDGLTRKVIGAAIKVHRSLGPGLLESVYEECLCVELGRQTIPFVRQKFIPIVYEGILIAADLRFDLLIADQVVVELKCVERLAPIHKAQLLTYLRLMRRRVGLLINFHVPVLKDGITRMVNGYSDSVSPCLGG
ncbi:MAG TPA: GxxExxY protein [Thermoplasmata archaeon]|nr:GxxExxY protein [Thermoplasmata archaeon]